MTFIAEITHGELALIISVMGDGAKVSSQSLRQWMGEGKLPDGWTRPKQKQGLIETVMMSRRIADALKRGSPSGTKMIEVE